MKTRLAKFTVRGYRNFAAPVSVDFTLIHDYDFNPECVEDGVITKFGVFGPNGSGKTNLGHAMFNIVARLTHKSTGVLRTRTDLFLNLDDETEEAVFSYTFKVGGHLHTLEYGMAGEEKMTWESYAIDQETVYDYNYAAQAFREKNFALLGSPAPNFACFQDNLSVFRYIASNSALAKDSPMRAIMDYVPGMLWISSEAFAGLDYGPVVPRGLDHQERPCRRVRGLPAGWT